MHADVTAATGVSLWCHVPSAQHPVPLCFDRRRSAAVHSRTASGTRLETRRRPVQPRDRPRSQTEKLHNVDIKPWNFISTYKYVLMSCRTCQQKP